MTKNPTKSKKAQGLFSYLEISKQRVIDGIPNEEHNLS